MEIRGVGVVDAVNGICELCGQNEAIVKVSIDGKETWVCDGCKVSLDRDDSFKFMRLG